MGRPSTTRNIMAGPSCILAILVLTAVISVSLPNELPSSCAAVLCEAGTVCRLQNVNCVTPPCLGCVATNKPGSCPVPKSGLSGICIARCSTDADCDGDQKCCGGCPRQCTSPVLP